MSMENYVEVTHALARYETMLPNGDYEPTSVDNPQIDDSEPDYLRVSVPRKGMTFKVIRAAEEMGLRVDDIWQLDADKDADRIRFKLVPRE